MQYNRSKILIIILILALALSSCGLASSTQSGSTGTSESLVIDLSNISTAESDISSTIEDNSSTSTAESQSHTSTAESESNTSTAESESNTSTAESESSTSTAESESHTSTAESGSHTSTAESESNTSTAESESNTSTAESESNTSTAESESHTSAAESESHTSTAESSDASEPEVIVTLSSISAEYKGSSLEIGKNVSKTDIIVKAKYSDNSTKTVSDFTVSPSTITKAGNNTITVSYSGKSTTIVIEGILAPTAESTAVLKIGEKSLWYGMTESELKSNFGEPAGKLASFKSYTWYVYNIDDYEDFFLAGVESGQVVAIFGNSKSFSYQGIGFNSVCPIQEEDNEVYKGVRTKAYTTLGGYTVTYYVDHNNTDSNGNALVHSVAIEKTAYIKNRAYYSYDEASATQGALLNFYILNAFRVCHGLNILRWSEAAAAVATAHSKDMATQNYFSHTALDGRKMSDRLTDYGIKWRRCGENLAAGSDTAINTHNGWVNSAGHRQNLVADFEEIGIGASYNDDADYDIYWTQNFVTQR